MLRHFMKLCLDGKHIRRFSYADGDGTIALDMLVEKNCSQLQALGNHQQCVIYFTMCVANLIHDRIL